MATVILNIAERQVAAGQVFQRTFTPQSAAMKVRIVLRHPEWPDGACVRGRVVWAGAPFAEFQASGGVRYLDKLGTPRPAADLTDTTFSVNKPEGITECELQIEALQDLTTALTIERV
jgi:hypothetical protein